MFSFHVKIVIHHELENEHFDTFRELNYVLVGRQGHRWEAAKAVKAPNVVEALASAVGEVSGLVDGGVGNAQTDDGISSKIVCASVMTEQEYFRQKTLHGKTVDFGDDEKSEKFHGE